MYNKTDNLISVYHFRVFLHSCPKCSVFTVQVHFFYFKVTGWLIMSLSCSVRFHYFFLHPLSFYYFVLSLLNLTLYIFFYLIFLLTGVSSKETDVIDLNLNTHEIKSIFTRTGSNWLSLFLIWRFYQRTAN